MKYSVGDYFELVENRFKNVVERNLENADIVVYDQIQLETIWHDMPHAHYEDLNSFYLKTIRKVK